MPDTKGQDNLEHDDASAFIPYLSEETTRQLLDGKEKGGYGLPVTPLITTVHDAAQNAAKVDKPE